jgi:hypothetical protein
MDFIAVSLSIIVLVSWVQVHSLVIWIDPLLLGFSGLKRLLTKVLFSNSSEASLELSIGENLLSTDSLLLHGIKLIFFDFLLFHELLLIDLLLSLKIDFLSFMGSESLEMIRLFPMVCEHTDLSVWVLGHKIVIKSVIQLMFLQVSPLIVLGNLSILFLLSEDPVDTKSLLLVFRSLSIMLALGVLEIVVEF